MRKMLKILALLFVISAVVFAAGCATKKTDDGTRGALNQTVPTVTPTETLIVTPTETSIVTPTETHTETPASTNNATENVTANPVNDIVDKTLPAVDNAIQN